MQNDFVRVLMGGQRLLLKNLIIHGLDAREDGTTVKQRRSRVTKKRTKSLVTEGKDQGLLQIAGRDDNLLKERRRKWGLR